MHTHICLLFLLAMIPRYASATGQVYVLVWEDAYLHTAPRDDTPKARAAAWPRGRAGKLGHVRVFERLAEQGDWVQVANVTDEVLGLPRHCSDPQWNLSSYRLKLWVRRAGLAPVLMKTVATQFKDGTAVTIRAGSPVWPDEGSLQRVAATGRAVSLSLPDDVVGTSYRPARRLADDVPFFDKKHCPGGFLAQGTELTVAGTRPITGAGGSYPCSCIAKAEKVGQRHRVTLRSACLELTAWSSKPPRKDDDGSSAVFGVLTGKRPIKVKVRSGAPVRWIDGSPAGKTLHEVWLDPKQIEGDQPRCAAIPLAYGDGEDSAPEAERSLTLCFDKADTQRARHPMGDVIKDVEAAPAPAEEQTER